MLRGVKTKILAILLLVAILNVAIAPTAHAGVWGESLLATTIKMVWEELSRIIRTVLVQALKGAALEILTTTYENLLTAGSLHAMMFIADWQDYLYTTPVGKSKFFMNDFFVITARGRNVMGNYKACAPKDKDVTPHLKLRGGPDVEGVGLDDVLGQKGANYYNYLIERAKNTTIEIKMPEITLPEATCDPFNLFADDNWKAYSSFIAVPSNNPFGFTLVAQDAFNAKQEQEKKKAEAEAQANQGYNSKKDKTGRYVMTPGAAVKEAHTSIKNISNAAMANCEDFACVIAGMITRVATKAMAQGIGQVQKKIQKEINSKIEGYSKDLDAWRKDKSPKEQFKASY